MRTKYIMEAHKNRHLEKSFFTSCSTKYSVQSHQTLRSPLTDEHLPPPKKPDQSVPQHRVFVRGRMVEDGLKMRVFDTTRFCTQRRLYSLVAGRVAWWCPQNKDNFVFFRVIWYLRPCTPLASR